MGCLWSAKNFLDKRHSPQQRASRGHLLQIKKHPIKTHPRDYYTEKKEKTMDKGQPDSKKRGLHFDGTQVGCAVRKKGGFTAQGHVTHHSCSASLS
jgi:hypothetical protein